jgi:hypothetical protein
MLRHFCTRCIYVSLVIIAVPFQRLLASSRSLATTVEPPDHNLFKGQAFLRQQLQQVYGIRIAVLEELSYNREEIPHAFWIMAYQWPQEV